MNRKIVITFSVFCMNAMEIDHITDEKSKKLSIKNVLPNPDTFDRLKQAKEEIEHQLSYPGYNKAYLDQMNETIKRERFDLERKIKSYENAIEEKSSFESKLQKIVHDMEIELAQYELCYGAEKTDKIVEKTNEDELAKIYTFDQLQGIQERISIRLLAYSNQSLPNYKQRKAELAFLSEKIDRIINIKLKKLLLASKRWN